MKIARIAALALGLLASTSAFAGQEAEAAAIRLLDSMGMETVLMETMDVSLDAQLSQNPEMTPYRNVFRAFLAKHMSYEALKPKLAAAYATEFSAAELDEAAAFYGTPTGKKFLSKLPTLFSRGVQIGQDAVKEHLPELQEAIRAESLRLKNAGNASNSR